VFYSRLRPVLHLPFSPILGRRVCSTCSKKQWSVVARGSKLSSSRAGVGAVGSKEFPSRLRKFVLESRSAGKGTVRRTSVSTCWSLRGCAVYRSWVSPIRISAEQQDGTEDRGKRGATKMVAWGNGRVEKTQGSSPGWRSCCWRVAQGFEASCRADGDGWSWQSRV
jgi:hypothetical protein